MNPDNVNMIYITNGGHDGFHVEINFSDKNHYHIYFKDLKDAEEYLNELVDQCQETSEILNRLDDLETAIKYIPGGSEYQNISNHFESLSG